MKILWFTTTSTWALSLADVLASGNELLIACPAKESQPLSPDKKYRFVSLNVTDQEIVGEPLTPTVFKKYIKIIEDFKPDIIHVHGTERNVAQIQNYITDIPIVISIQGIVTGCIPYAYSYISENDLVPYKTLKNILLRGGVSFQKKYFEKHSEMFEKDILQKGRYYICRTHWDKAWITFSNSSAFIFHGEEVLRESFYQNANRWDLNNCMQHNIFMTAGFNPIKGLHLAIKAVALLKKEFPDVTLTVPGLPTHILKYGKIKSRLIGEEFINYCKDLIVKNGLEDNIILLPRLDAEGMTREILRANVFLSPTTIDNSPNSIGEATMLGIPIVASPVGGVPSMLHDEESCLFAPAGDEYIMAYQIKRIFEDRMLALKLSKNAYQVAIVRHNKQSAYEQYMNAYKKIISIHHKKNRKD